MESTPAARRRVPLGRLLLPLLAALGLCAEAHGQTPARSLTGTVVNGGDSTPVASAFVEIAGTTLRTATDADGRFAFARTPPGTLTLRVARIGFLPATIRLRTDSAATPASLSRSCAASRFSATIPPPFRKGKEVRKLPNNQLFCQARGRMPRTLSSSSARR
jgi:hypothetical protein